MDKVSTVKGKSGLATSDVELMVTLTRKNFNNILNVLTCGGKTCSGGGCHPHCWSCGAVRNLAKLCLGKNLALQTQSSKAEQSKAEVPKKAPIGSSEWTEVVRKGSKVATLLHQQGVTSKGAAKSPKKQPKQQLKQKQQQQPVGQQQQLEWQPKEQQQ